MGVIEGLRHTYREVTTVRRLVEDVAVSLEIKDDLDEADKSVRLGQSIHRTRKARRRAHWLQILEQVETCKYRVGQDPCDCGQAHRIIELILGGQHVASVCPVTYRLRLMALHIERKWDLIKWLETHPRGFFVKSLSQNS